MNMYTPLKIEGLWEYNAYRVIPHLKGCHKRKEVVVLEGLTTSTLS